jgi:hypothetical protein
LSTPAGLSHQDARAARLEIYQILRGAALRAREAASATDTAASAPPLGAGARPTQHESDACPGQEMGVAFEEDDREAITTDNKSGV